MKSALKVCLGSLRVATASLLVLLLAAACGGNANTLPSASPKPAIDAGLGISEQAWDITHPPQATPVPASSDLLYVSNIGTNTITVYAHDQQGNTPPRWVIGGSNSGLSHPGQLAEDAQGNLYVANNSYPLLPSANSNFGYGPPSVLVFAHGAKGNVSPIRTLGGTNTGILSIDGMTVDQATGKIYVTSAAPETGGFNDPGANLIRFPPNSTGNAKPFAVSWIGEQTNELAQDSSGKNIITWQTHPEFVPDMDEATFAKQFYNGGSLTPVYQIGGDPSFNGTADDATSHTYLATGGMQVCPSPTSSPVPISGILRFQENTNGDVASYLGCEVAPPFITAPASVITSDTCGGQLVLGYLRNIYVIGGGDCESDAIVVYQHDASGNASPLRVLKGPATQLSDPAGIYEGK